MINLYGDISPRTALKAAKMFLKVMQPLTVTQRYAQQDHQPQNSSQTRKWRRYENYPENKASLSEGVTPPGHAITYTDVTAILRQYGDRVNLTDVIQDTHEDPVLKIMTQRSAEQAAQTIELITIDIIKAGTNVVYAGGAVSRTALVSELTRGDLRIAVRTLDRAIASPIANIISPTAKVSTQGVEPAFYAMGHTDLEPDIRNITGFKSIVEYGNPANATPAEIGAVERVRFVLTQNFDSWEETATGASGQSTFLTAGASGTGSADVYPVIIVARDAYAVVRLQGRNAIRMMVLNPGIPRGGDEAGQRGSVAWKTWFAGVILNESWLIRVECLCTANPV